VVRNRAHGRVESVCAGVDLGGMRRAIGNGCRTLGYGDVCRGVDCRGCTLRGYVRGGRDS
jgi:hypothetical protein